MILLAMHGILVVVIGKSMTAMLSNGGANVYKCIYHLQAPWSPVECFLYEGLDTLLHNLILPISVQSIQGLHSLCLQNITTLWIYQNT